MIDWVSELDRIFPERMAPAGKIVANTDDWYRARRGRCTASKRAQTIAVGSSRSWASMAAEIEYELCDGWSRKEFSNRHTDWGQNHEAEAIANAELELGEESEEPGLVFHPKYPFAAGTPDFFMGKNISGQIKCPSLTHNHLKFVYEKKLPGTYYYQVQWEAWISQRTRIVFMSYDPRQPIATRCALIEMDADQNVWNIFESRLLEFKEKFQNAAVKQPIKFQGFGGIPEIF